MQPGAIGGEEARTGKQQPAGAMAPGADQRRQAGDGAHGIAAAAHALHAVVQADGGRLGGAVGTRQVTDLLHRDTADGRGAFGRPAQGPLTQRVPAKRMAGDVIVVQPVVHHQFVHQRKRQGRIAHVLRDGPGVQMRPLRHPGDP